MAAGETRRDEVDAPHMLGVFVEGSINGRQIESVREFDDDEFRRYVADVTAVLGFVSDYQQFAMVRHSYVDYTVLLDKYRSALANHAHLNEVLKEKLVHGVNRRLRGFFSEFRVFLDYTETKLKRRYGEDSEQLRAFKEACRRQFDESFAYRFVYQLRNYAQHVNLPLNALSLASGEREFDPGDPATHNRLSVAVNRDILLRDGFDWRRDVRPTLEALPASFELNPYIDGMMSCLEKIHIELLCAKLTGEKAAAERILALSASVVGKLGVPCVIRIDGSPESIINGYTFHMERAEENEGSGPDRIAVHVGWVPMQVAQAIVDLPDTVELARYEYIDLDMDSHTLDGDPVDVPL